MTPVTGETSRPSNRLHAPADIPESSVVGNHTEVIIIHIAEMSVSTYLYTAGTETPLPGATVVEGPWGLVAYVRIWPPPRNAFHRRW